MHIISLLQSGLNQRLERLCQNAGDAYFTLNPLAISLCAWRQCQPDAIQWLPGQDFLIFLSPNAVDGFVAGGQAIWPSAATLIAIGAGTAAALAHHTTQPVLRPTVTTSEGVLALDCLQRIAGQCITLIKGEGGRPLLAEQLTLRGAQVYTLIAYLRSRRAIDVASLTKIWQNSQQTLIVATSFEALSSAVEQLPPPLLSWFLQRPLLVSSERLYTLAVSLGFKRVESVPHMSETELFHTITAIKECL